MLVNNINNIKMSKIMSTSLEVGKENNFKETNVFHTNQFSKFDRFCSLCHSNMELSRLTLAAEVQGYP